MEEVRDDQRAAAPYELDNEQNMVEDIRFQVGTKMFLRNPSGRYLLLHRSMERYPDVKGRWDIPGGRIDPGTTLLANLKREVKEETGLELVGEPTLIAAQDIFSDGESHVVRLTYMGEAKEGPIQLSEEHDAYRWVEKKEMEQSEGVDIYIRTLLRQNVLR